MKSISCLDNLIDSLIEGSILTEEEIFRYKGIIEQDIKGIQIIFEKDVDVNAIKRLKSLYKDKEEYQLEVYNKWNNKNITLDELKLLNELVEKYGKIN